MRCRSTALVMGGAVDESMSTLPVPWSPSTCAYDCEGVASLVVVSEVDEEVSAVVVARCLGTKTGARTQLLGSLGTMVVGVPGCGGAVSALAVVELGGRAVPPPPDPVPRVLCGTIFACDDRDGVSI